MILDLDKTKKYIVNWIKNYAENAGINTLVVGLSGGIDSALVALLCKETGLPTVCVNMPCHSSGSSYERAKNFAEEQNLNFMTVDLTSAYDSILMQMTEDKRAKSLTNEGMNNPVALGGLRSCLRAPTLSYVALATHGLIMGTGNRSEDNLIRYFQKYGDGCVDVSPIADLFKSEVYELFYHMTGMTSETRTNVNAGEADTVEVYHGPPAAVAIFMATPTADLWGPDGNQTDEDELGISYDEIEWADRQNMLTGSLGTPIIIDDGDPTKHKSWMGYTARQRFVIAKVHQLEKISRHKHNPSLPVCEVRQEPGLVQ